MLRQRIRPPVLGCRLLPEYYWEMGYILPLHRDALPGLRSLLFCTQLCNTHSALALLLSLGIQFQLQVVRVKSVDNVRGGSCVRFCAKPVPAPGIPGGMVVPAPKLASSECQDCHQAPAHLHCSTTAASPAAQETCKACMARSHTCRCMHTWNVVSGNLSGLWDPVLASIIHGVRNTDAHTCTNSVAEVAAGKL